MNLRNQSIYSPLSLAWRRQAGGGNSTASTSPYCNLFVSYQKSRLFSPNAQNGSGRFWTGQRLKYHAEIMTQIFGMMQASFHIDRDMITLSPSQKWCHQFNVIEKQARAGPKLTQPRDNSESWPSEPSARFYSLVWWVTTLTVHVSLPSPKGVVNHTYYLRLYPLSLQGCFPTAVYSSLEKRSNSGAIVCLRVLHFFWMSSKTRIYLLLKTFPPHSFRKRLSAGRSRPAIFGYKRRRGNNQLDESKRSAVQSKFGEGGGSKLRRKLKCLHIQDVM